MMLADRHETIMKDDGITDKEIKDYFDDLKVR